MIIIILSINYKKIILNYLCNYYFLYKKSVQYIERFCIILIEIKLLYHYFLGNIEFIIKNKSDYNGLIGNRI